MTCELYFANPWLRTSSDEWFCNKDKRTITVSNEYLKSVNDTIYTWALRLLHSHMWNQGTWLCKFSKYGHLLLNFWQLFGNHLSVALIREENARPSPPSQNFYSRKQSVMIFRKEQSSLKLFNLYLYLPKRCCK